MSQPDAVWLADTATNGIPQLFRIDEHAAEIEDHCVHHLSDASG